MTLGNKIQEIRNARGMSQEQFGEMLGTTRQTVSKWELDQVVPDIRKIVAISKLFCVPTEELLLHVTTFESEGVRFSCGVYRNSKSEIVETEKLALEYYCNEDKSVMGAKLYEGNGDVKSLIAVSPQETAVAPGLSVRENLELMCGIHGFSKEKRSEKISQLTELLGLEPVINKRAKKLSGGWQRRLSIAMALISEPKILFMDEPTLGLDVLARSDLWDIIRSLKGTVTMVLTTHYMEEAEALSDRIAIMKDGKLLICDTAEKIKEMAGTDQFEQAFIRIVKGVGK